MIAPQNDRPDYLESPETIDTSAEPLVQPATGDDPAEIRAEMKHTRAELSETINAIQERLDPEHLKQQVTDNVREATIGKAEQVMSRVDYAAREAKSSFVDTIRRNPIPAAMVGAGLTWLFLSGSNRSRPMYESYPRYAGSNDWSERPAYGGQTTPSGLTDYDEGSSISDTAQNLAGQATSRVQSLGQGAQQLGSRAQDQVESLTSQVQGTAQQVTQKARDQVEDLGSDVQGQIEWLTTNAERALRESPLAVGAAALAVGVVVGLAAPGTPPENQLFGDAREQFVQKAQEAAQDALDNAQKLAEQAQSSMKASQ